MTASGHQSQDRSSAPAVVASVLDEIHPGDPGVWHPQSYAEWEAIERTKTFLTAWSAQVGDERALRRDHARWIFGLIVFQVVAVLGIVVAQGRGLLTLDIALLKVLLPSVLGEVFGLGYLVTKYLFSQPLRHSLDSLATGARSSLPPAEADSLRRREPNTNRSAPGELVEAS